MRSSVAALLLLFVWAWPCAAQGTYEQALPGYPYKFPRDHFNHPGFQTEWWYYTGNVTANDGHRFGFELTFFRQGVSRDSGKQETWDLRDLYLAHLALSDLGGKEFYHSERTNRAGPGIAGIDQKQGRIWNGNWKATWNGDDLLLEAVDERFSFSLTLHSEKPAVIHGENGVSQKAQGAGHASHYISLTRLKTNGNIKLNGKDFAVYGLAWMDHEFFTLLLEKDQVGWDWFSLQLSDNTELMLFRIRRKDGSIDPFSAGTYIEASGKAQHLRKEDFSLWPTEESWKSSVTGAVYPVRWRILIPKLEMELEATTLLKSQELSGQSKLVPSYWEGAIDIKGQQGKTGLAGVGYLEMTGYDHAVEFGLQKKE
jgi:predicted secreted hydrolase